MMTHNNALQAVTPQHGLRNYYGSRDFPWWVLSSYSHWRVTPVRVGPMHKCSTSHSEEEERIEDRVRDEAAARGLERLERSVLDIP